MRGLRRATTIPGRPGRATADYAELCLPGGHIGMFVLTKSPGIVGKGMVDWLVGRQLTGRFLR